jgi:hypothetical protein
MLSQFSKYYLQLGSFPFTSTLLANTHVKAGTNIKGDKWVYFGEKEYGSTMIGKRRGIGIINTGEVQVGHWDKDQMNGLTRGVYDNGS